MKKNQSVSFDNFLTLFPEVELPMVISTDIHIEFSRHNIPIPGVMIDRYLSSTHDDEFTEYIACFSIPNTKSFHAIVVWRAGLMEYEYHLVTFDKSGNLLDKRVIAGTKSDGKLLTRSVATIEADWLINIVEGNEIVQEDGESTFNPSSSKVVSLEMTLDGDIMLAD
jgi:hypothetical protein